MSRWRPALLVVLPYAALVQMGYRFVVAGGVNASAFWPANGIAFAAFTCAPRRAWAPMLAILTVAYAFLAVLNGTGPAVAFGFAVANGVQWIVGAHLFRRLCGTTLAFRRLREVLVLALVTVLVATPLGALLAAAVGRSAAPTIPSATLFRAWWLGETLGCLLIVPAVLTLRRGGAAELLGASRARWLEAVSLLVVTLVFCRMRLGSETIGRGQMPFHMLIPLLAWAALRFGTRAVSLLNLVIASFAVRQLHEAYGDAVSLGADLSEHVLALQSFLAVAYGAQMVASLHLETKSALRELAARTSQYRSIAEVAPIALFRGDASGRVVYVNERFTQMTGLTVADFEGRRLREIVHPDDLASVPTFEELTEGPVDVGDVRIVARDGRVHWVFGAIVPVHSDDEGPSYVGTLTDVTERRLVEAQLRQSEKMDAVGRLAGGVAHDFNNVLTAILGFGDVVLARLDRASPLHGMVDQMVRAGHRAADLTQRLLAYGRKQVLHLAVLQLNDVVAESLEQLQPLVGPKVTLRVELEPELARTRADPRQLIHVLVELVLNARDALGQEPGTITVATHFAAEGPERAALLEPLDPSSRGFVVVSVSDDGPGMDDETRRHVFEPFFTTKGDKGTGLGLSTVIGIVRQSAGAIVCTSHVGVGTRFDVYLPCVESVATTTRVTRSGIAPKRATRTETLLVVDDEDDVRLLMRQVLETAGYRVLAARNADEAEQLAHGFEGRIALLVTDVAMPGVRGPELARRLRETRSDLSVLYVSGFSERPLVLPENDFVDFLQKPFSPDDLLAHVDALVASGESPIARGGASRGV